MLSHDYVASKTEYGNSVQLTQIATAHALGEFGKLFMVHTLKDVLKKYGESASIVEAKKMATELKSPVATLRKLVDEAQHLHRERSKMQNIGIDSEKKGPSKKKSKKSE